MVTVQPVTVGTLQRFVLDVEAQLAEALRASDAATADFASNPTDAALSWMSHASRRVVGLAGELIAARRALRVEIDERARFGAAS